MLQAHLRPQCSLAHAALARSLQPGRLDLRRCQARQQRCQRPRSTPGGPAGGAQRQQVLRLVQVAGHHLDDLGGKGGSASKQDKHRQVPSSAAANVAAEVLLQEPVWGVRLMKSARLAQQTAALPELQQASQVRRSPRRAGPASPQGAAGQLPPAGQPGYGGSAGAR